MPPLAENNKPLMFAINQKT